VGFAVYIYHIHVQLYDYILCEQLQSMEQEAREHLQRGLEAKRDAALVRRDINLERKSNMDKLKHKQGITPPWVWSYFIPWPKESYDL